MRYLSMNEETLFHLAREKPPDERAAFLDEACADDTALRQRLEILLAAQKLASEKPGQTLQPTALVHEAYLRLVGSQSEDAQLPSYKDRGHFFAAAATAMRRIIIDTARRKKTRKRGGAFQRQPLEAIAAPEADEELLALDEALDKLTIQDPAKARLVELRYFAGLTGEQAAAVLGISPTTADRH